VICRLFPCGPLRSQIRQRLATVMNYDRPAHRIDNAIATPKPLSFKFPARSTINFALVINNTLASFRALNAVKVDLIESSDKGRRIHPCRFDDFVRTATSSRTPSNLDSEQFWRNHSPSRNLSLSSTKCFRNWLNLPMTGCVATL
jgi:hypothetical protein